MLHKFIHHDKQEAGSQHAVSFPEHWMYGDYMVRIEKGKYTVTDEEFSPHFEIEMDWNFCLDDLGHVIDLYDTTRKKAFERGRKSGIRQEVERRRQLKHSEIDLDCISHIEALYPADDNEKGRELLLESIYSCWRDLPSPILEDYKNKCVREDNR